MKYLFYLTIVILSVSGCKTASKHKTPSSKDKVEKTVSKTDKSEIAPMVAPAQKEQITGIGGKEEDFYGTWQVTNVTAGSTEAFDNLSQITFKQGNMADLMQGGKKFDIRWSNQQEASYLEFGSDMSIVFHGSYKFESNGTLNFSGKAYGPGIQETSIFLYLVKN